MSLLESRMHKAMRPHECAVCRKPVASGSTYYRDRMPSTPSPKEHAFHLDCYRKVAAQHNTTEEL